MITSLFLVSVIFVFVNAYGEPIDSQNILHLVHILFIHIYDHLFISYQEDKQVFFSYLHQLHLKM